MTRQYSITLENPVKCPFRAFFETSELACAMGAHYEKYFYCTFGEKHSCNRKCNDDAKFPDFCVLTEVKECHQ